MTKNEHLYWISTKTATYGVITDGNKIIHSAPIARKFIGKTIQDLQQFFLDRRIKYEMREIK